MKALAPEKSHPEWGKYVGNPERTEENSQAEYPNKSIRNDVNYKTNLQSTKIL